MEQNNTRMPEAKKKTFLALISSQQVRIPNYQREYAQGRPNTKAELIRTGFVQSLKDALVNSEPLELDFIFGGSETDDAFLPVDGQQRLTMLFLLHWYIFARANRTGEIAGWAEKFVYATRSTSEDFCRELCKPEARTYDFSAAHLARQIKDKHWCTGSMQADPTVRSMLVVLDEIHSQFATETDFDGFAGKLQADDCPITFYCLDLQGMGDDGVKDLYIKMNARGVALTDFELFKADLQKKRILGDSFDLLGAYLSDRSREDTAENRTRLIGQFNNEYTDFFFNLIDEGKIMDTLISASGERPVQKQMFDTAMMNFILEIFCADYFCTISEVAGISQRDYTNHVDAFRKMSGKEFSRFIEKRGDPFNTKYLVEKKTNVCRFPDSARTAVQETLCRSLSCVITLLDLFCKDPNALAAPADAKCCFNCADLIKAYATVPTNQEMMCRIGLFAFFLHFGRLPETEEAKAAFRVWNRFVWKIEKNTPIKNAYEAIETIRGYRDILSGCPGDRCTPETIWKAIAAITLAEDEDHRITLSLKGRNALAASAAEQLHEEVIKANLIVADPKWAEILTTAEDYFSKNGQLWFLLRLNDQPYDPGKFEETFAVAKEIFDHNKELHNISSNLFEKALLVQPEFKDEDHLDTMGKHTPNTKRFVGKEFSDHVSHSFENSNISREQTQFAVTLALLKKLLSKDSATTVEDWLRDYIADHKGNTVWKELFVRQDLIGQMVNGLEFKNGFEPNAPYPDSSAYTAVYTNHQKRTVSGELNTFALAVALDRKHQTVKYHSSAEENYLDPNGFPHRYVIVNGVEIGFKEGTFILRDGTVIGDLSAAIDWACSVPVA